MGNFYRDEINEYGKLFVLSVLWSINCGEQTCVKNYDSQKQHLYNELTVKSHCKS